MNVYFENQIVWHKVCYLFLNDSWFCKWPMSKTVVYSFVGHIFPFLINTSNQVWLPILWYFTRVQWLLKQMGQHGGYFNCIFFQCLCWNVVKVICFLCNSKEYTLSFGIVIFPIDGYRIAGKFGRVKLWRIRPFWVFGGKKFGEWTSANRLSIVTSNLYGFSLANHRRFAKFAKLSPCQTFPLYGSYFLKVTTPTLYIHIHIYNIYIMHYIIYIYIYIMHMSKSMNVHTTDL